MSKKSFTREESIAMFIIVLGLLTISTPWFATQSGMDISIFITPMFLIVGILNIVAGIALFLSKPKS
ncbi:MAG: hypothetical protein QXI11_04755 [Thermoproteota archaeon]